MLCLGQRVRMRPVGWPQVFRRGMRVQRAVCQLMGAGGGNEAAAVEC